ncbi:MAG: CoA-binding protein [Candidatus Aenigmarchaeota archaeon]|nr:CoA-binding protein [Candidatus Aenigmarchaeota archaeon]
MDIDNFFSAKSIAIVGVSKDPKKVGHVIFRNFIDGEFRGKLFVVNPNADEILGHKAYKSVLDIKDPIDLVIIAIPAELVPKIIDECGKKKIHHAIIVTSGFKEVGNDKLDRKLEQTLKRNKILAIGPNGLGTFDAYSKLDSLFLPRYRLQRPKEGNISFVCQSGAVGSAILDYATDKGYKFSKFASYGNAMNVDESDLLEYMGNDPNTKVICLYVEAVKDGKKFLAVAKRVSMKKPIVAIKGGKTEEGSKAALSHTGSLAGSAAVYSAVFRQCNIIEASSLGEMFDIAKMFEICALPMGRQVQVITNGGGYGILSTDAIVTSSLKMAQMSAETLKELRKQMPVIATVNPMDLLGDATTERYKIAINAALKDYGVDILLLIVLYQTPLVSTDIVDIIVETNDLCRKPIVCVSTGGEFTETLKKNLESNGVPCYNFPEDAVRAIEKFVQYHRK